MNILRGDALVFDNHDPRLAHRCPPAWNVSAMRAPPPSPISIVAPSWSAKVRTSLNPSDFVLEKPTPSGNADAVIADLQPDLMALVLAASRFWMLAGSCVRKRVLQRVGNQLIDDQPARNGGVHGQPEIVDRRRDLDAPRIDSIRTEQVIRELVDVRREIDFGEIFGLIQPLVNQSHGVNPVLALLKHPASRGILDGARLEAQKAGDYLKIVLDPMVNFLEKDFLFPKGGANRFIRDLAGRDIAKNYGEEPAVSNFRFRDGSFRGEVDAALPAAENLAALAHGAAMSRPIRKSRGYGGDELL